MPAPTRLQAGKTYVVIQRFDYLHPLTGVTWAVEVGDRVVLLTTRKDGADWRIRVGALTFNVGGEWLAARVAATSEGK